MNHYIDIRLFPPPYNKHKVILRLFVPLIASYILFFFIPCGYAAEPANLVHDLSSSNGFKLGCWNTLVITPGSRTITLPSYVDKIKVTTIGAGGGANYYGYNSSAACYGGGGGAVVQNVLINIGSNKSLALNVGKGGGWKENGGDTYVTYNGTRYAYAAGGKAATNSAGGAAGGSGGGRGGAVRVSGVINNAGSGLDGTAGGRTYVQNAAQRHITAGGGGSWTPGIYYNWVNNAFVACYVSENRGYLGCGAACYYSMAEGLFYSSGTGNGAVAISYAASVTGISVSTAPLSLSVGDSGYFTVTFEPSQATNKSVTWSSNNPNVASVDSSGRITAKANGTAIITVKSVDNPRATATRTVIVTTKTSGVTVTPESAALNVGTTKQLTATVAPSTASNKSVTWTSSDNTIATVSSTGLVTAKGNGTATITARTASGGYTDTCTITVTTHVTGVSLSSSSLTINKGGTSQLTATVSPTTASNKSITWSTSDPAVSTVSQTGLVTAVGGGTANITVTTVDGSYSAQCRITVNIPVTGVRFNDSASSASIGTDSTAQLSYMIEPSDASNKTVTWQSSNPAVATVDTDTGIITPLAPGGTEITVTTIDGNFSDTVFLMVTSSLEPVQLDLVTEDGYYPDYGTTYIKTSGNVVKYPGVPVDSSGMLTASIPSAPQDCDLAVSLLNTLIAGTSVNTKTKDIPAPLYMVEGDLNNDNVIDGTDYTILIQRMHYDGGLSEYGLVGDLNYDGAVDDLDLMMFNGPVKHTGQSRFMQRGYDIIVGNTEIQTNASEEPPVPVQSIIKTEPTSDGRYEISLSQSTEPVNRMQLSREGDLSETSVAVPEGFDLIGVHTEAGKSVVAIGSPNRDGSVVLSDVKMVTVKSNIPPVVKYGPHETVMQKITESGIEEVSWETAEDAAGSSGTGNSGSGCNMGLGVMALLAGVPLLKKHNR